MRILGVIFLLLTSLTIIACSPKQSNYGAGGDGNDFGPRIAATCFFSHESKADAIFKPTTEPPAHWHDFYGNKTTDNNSTYQSLLQGPSECKQERDNSAWWQPNVYWGGQEINANRAVIYFQPSDNLPKNKIKPFPAGFEAVARKPLFQCGKGEFQRQAFTNCSENTMKIRLTYEQCLDPRSDEVEANLVKPRDDKCPDTHPRQLPEIQYDVTFPLPDSTGPITVAGTVHDQQSPDTFHSDFINAWDQQRLVELVDDCIIALEKDDPRPSKCRTSDNA